MSSCNWGSCTTAISNTTKTFISTTHETFDTVCSICVHKCDATCARDMTLYLSRGWPNTKSYLTLSTPYISTTTFAPPAISEIAQMGNSASKAGKTAGSAVRKYPTRSPQSATTRIPATSAPSAPAQAPIVGPTVHPPVQATQNKTQGTYSA
jgi:hypothetical protein